LFGRRRISIATVLGLGAVALIAARDGIADSGAERWIIEPGPEAPDGQKLGAAEVERAQKLAKAKQYAEAVVALEQVARTWPAAIHDCNLALAYLRAGALTRAQLAWDLSALRNGTRPKWCTGDVSTQLSTALRAAGYVPTTIDVVPARDAVIEVGGVAMRNLRTVWLPPGPATIGVAAPERASRTENVTIAGPRASFTITLEVVRPPPAVTPDAGVGAEPVAVPPDAAPSVEPRAEPPSTEPPSSLVSIDGKPVGRRNLALTVAIAGFLGAGVFGAYAYDSRRDANMLYPTDPEFEDEKANYDGASTLALASLAVGAVGTAFFIYFLATEDRPVPGPGNLQIGASRDGVGISYGGTFGGGK
jgi:hypothetical protein